MIPGSFEYLSPSSLSEAISLLQKHGEGAKILSGGHSLIPMMKLRLASPEFVVDINGVPDLSYIKEEGDSIKIGGLTREVDLEESALIAEKLPIISDASKLIADPQVRNFGTVGGNLAHGDAANDHPAIMMALNAEIIATGSEGERSIAIDDFFQGFYQTALQPAQILTEIRIPTPAANSGGAYFKLERKVGDFATVGVAVQVSLGDDGNCASAGIGLTNVGPTPIRAERSQNALVGSALDEASIKEAAKMASEDCSPSADLRGSEEYKRNMVRVLTTRALNVALERAKS